MSVEDHTCYIFTYKSKNLKKTFYIHTYKADKIFSNSSYSIISKKKSFFYAKITFL